MNYIIYGQYTYFLFCMIYKESTLKAGMIYCQYAQNSHQAISEAAGEPDWNNQVLWILPSHKSGHGQYFQVLGLYIYGTRLKKQFVVIKFADIIQMYLYSVGFCWLSLLRMLSEVGLKSVAVRWCLVLYLNLAYLLRNKRIQSFVHGD